MPCCRRERRQHSIALFEPKYEDATVGELEADTTESSLGVIRARRSVGERHGYRIWLDLLLGWQLLVFVYVTSTAMH
jgi:hypothetical protein